MTRSVSLISSCTEQGSLTKHTGLGKRNERLKNGNTNKISHKNTCK